MLKEHRHWNDGWRKDEPNYRAHFLLDSFRSCTNFSADMWWTLCRPSFFGSIFSWFHSLTHCNTIVSFTAAVSHLLYQFTCCQHNLQRTNAFPGTFYNITDYRKMWYQTPDLLDERWSTLPPAPQLLKLKRLRPRGISLVSTNGSRSLFFFVSLNCSYLWPNMKIRNI